MPFGLSARKADYIFDLARRAASGEFDAEALRGMSDEEAAEYLCRLRGVGLWTAEMLLTFTLQRRDVLSFGDFGIRRGLRMLYRHREIDRERMRDARRDVSVGDSGRRSARRGGPGGGGEKAARREERGKA